MRTQNERWTHAHAHTHIYTHKCANTRRSRPSCLQSPAKSVSSPIKRLRMGHKCAARALEVEILLCVDRWMDVYY